MSYLSSCKQAREDTPRQGELFEAWTKLPLLRTRFGAPKRPAKPLGSDSHTRTGRKIYFHYGENFRITAVVFRPSRKWWSLNRLRSVRSKLRRRLVELDVVFTKDEELWLDISVGRRP